MKALRILALICLSACAGRKASPAEMPLTPSQGQEWWIVSGVAGAGTPEAIHFSFLFTLEPSENAHFATSFASIWEAKSGSFHFGHSISDSAYTSRQGRFPVVLRLPNSELNLGRSAGMLKAVLPQAAWAGDGGGWKMRWKHDRQSPFALHRLVDDPMASVAAPIRALRIENQEINNTYLNLCIIRNGDALLARKGSLCWLDFQLESGGHYSLLGHLEANGEWRPLGVVHWDAARNPHDENDLRLEASPYGLWPSAHSGKLYPLHYTLQSPAGQWRIQPCAQGQEIQLGQKSFWMGGMQVLESASGKAVGAGNMYIFSHQ